MTNGMGQALAAAALALAFASTSTSVLAQGAPPAGVSTGPLQETSGFNGAMTHSELQQLGDFLDRAHMLTGGDREKARAAAKEATTALSSTLGLGCEIADAEKIGHGKANANGKPVEVSIYEVACRNGMGCFLVAPGSEPPTGLSCFAAAATHAADVAAGGKSDFYCQLPANKDVNTMASAVLAGAGKTCSASKVEYFGQSSQTRTEYQEIACTDGGGFLLRTALVGAASPLTVMSCKEAAQQGLKCKLTDGGPVVMPVTADDFKAALVEHKVNCKPTNVRLIGQENSKKRYAVEFACPERPKGLVAFIPLQGNKNPFETMDCNEAVSRHLICQLTPQ